jgi:hypothetical protein
VGFRKVHATIQPPGLEKPDSSLFSIRLLRQRRRQTAKAVPHDAKRPNRLPRKGIRRLENGARQRSFDPRDISSEARKVIQ